MTGVHPAVLNHAAPWLLKTTFPVTRAHLTGADAPSGTNSNGINLVQTGINIGALFVVIGMFVGVGYLYKNYQ